jgi:tetratricopeptide (TPR) repeat protein
MTRHPQVSRSTRALTGAALALLANATALAAPGLPGSALTAAPSVRKTVRVSPLIVPPTADDAAGRELGFGIADRAAAELFATGRYNHFHLKQILSMAKRHAIAMGDLAQADTALRAATVIGAECGATGGLTRDAGGAWRLTGTAFDRRRNIRQSLKIELGSDTASAVRVGGRALAAAVAGFDNVELVKEGTLVHPDTGSAEAMTAYLACYATLVEQPMGLREAHVVDAKRIAAARKSCETAVSLDAAFAPAWAASSLASALAFENEAAAKALERARAITAYVPMTPIAHYWLATRFKSNREGAAVLKDAARASPGALIVLTYLGEHLNITKAYEGALDAWDQYLALGIDSPHAMAQKGYALAHLGRIEEAVRLTEEANRKDPSSLDVRLELASRLVDAKKLAEAAAILTPMLSEAGVTGEVVLRLGWVKLLEKSDDEAANLFKRALELAAGPSEWRTRGRARYDLAILAARQGRLEEAEDRILDAQKDGYVGPDLLEKEPDLSAVVKRPRVAALLKGPDLNTQLMPLQATPFATNRAGEIDLKAKRPPAMTGFTF